MNDTLITSSGIIRNRSKPRVGIVNASSLYHELLDDCFANGIDLSYESYKDETMTQLMNDNPELDDFAIEELFETESQNLELDSRVFLLGAWVKNSEGQYEIDKTGENGSYALEYNLESGIVSVEWSQFVTEYRNTSPCYVMADGSGPCGNLDSPGNEVIAFTLPPGYVLQ